MKNPTPAAATVATGAGASPLVDEAEGGAPSTRPGGVEWVDRNMVTQFANVVNVQGTREQIELFFGTNRTWNVAESDRVTVDLSSRVILTPFAAKRLWSVLGGVLREYETRHGALDIES